MENLHKHVINKKIRDEWISFTLWILCIIVNIIIIIRESGFGRESGASIWTILWCVLATRSYYKIKIFGLEYEKYQANSECSENDPDIKSCGLP
jgi:hypothetical protein